MQSSNYIKELKETLASSENELASKVSVNFNKAAIRKFFSNDDFKMTFLDIHPKGCDNAESSHMLGYLNWMDVRRSET